MTGRKQGLPLRPRPVLRAAALDDPRWASRQTTPIPISPLRGVAATVIVVSLLLAACSGGGRLSILRNEPLLGAPPGAVELARAEIGGNRWPVETATRIEALWGVDDPVAAVDWYLDNHAVAYHLDLNHVDEWLGGRSAGDTAIRAHVRLWKDLDDVRWDTYQFEPAEVDPWDGPVVVARVSTGG